MSQDFPNFEGRNPILMKKANILLLAAAALLASHSPSARAAGKGGIKPVPFTQVHISDSFWNQRLETLRNTTIRYAFRKIEEAGQVRNFEYAGRIVSGKARAGSLKFQSENPYDDAEVYKVVEGAAYLLAVRPDARLQHHCDSVIDLICSAQEPDGYLQTNFTIHNPLHPWYGGEKWKSDWNLSHETFNVGELIECAIAYYQATGKDKLLKCAIRAADNMCGVFNAQGLRMAPGHAVVEMALVRLYELTGNDRYLHECKFFLDCRGQRKFNPASADLRVNGKYWQDHLPAVRQRTAEGHAVRAMYFYSGMADWVRCSADKDYEAAVTAIWDNIAAKKLYVTGGFGARDNNEAFGENYELPNATAYCETCASVAGVMLNERMFRLHGEAKYIDMLERSLYNNVLDGLSIHGTSFYYPNRLEASERGNSRSQWFGTSCCPTNLCRLIPSVPGYVYATSDSSLYVNLYVASSATASVGRCRLEITQETAYPYDGEVRLAVKAKRGKGKLKDIRLRIPGWAKNDPVHSDLYSYENPTTAPVRLTVNGRDLAYSEKDGYAVVPTDGDGVVSITLRLPMDVHQVAANDSLATNRKLRSYERGPIVYCAEGRDNGGTLQHLFIPAHTTSYSLSTYMQEYFHGNMPSISVAGRKARKAGGRDTAPATQVRLIPYFARAYRGASDMKVWIPTDASGTMPEIDYIDHVQPADEADEKAHNLQGDNMRTGAELGWRDSDGGFIQYDMRIDPARPCSLMLKLWGGDSGNRRFDIYADGVRISHVEIDNPAPDKYYYTRHALPPGLTKGKGKVTVRLQSVGGSIVGGIFGVYTAASENAAGSL